MGYRTTRRQMKRKRRVARLYDIRVKLYEDDALKIKQVLACNSSGQVWTVEILSVLPVRNAR